MVSVQAGLTTGKPLAPALALRASASASASPSPGPAKRSVARQTFFPRAFVRGGVIPLSEVRVLDRNAEALGVSTATLMENAGRAVAERAARMAAGGAVLVLAGPGNNGGDGLVAARLLAERGVDTRVLAVGGGWKTSLARAQWDALPPGVRKAEAPSPAALADALREARVVVDALLGAGVSGDLREPYAAWVDAVRASGARVLSVDVPTGMGTSSAIVPEATVTFHDVKEGMSPQNCGEIIVVDIGIPRDATLYTGPGEYALYPQGKWDQHKGEGGIVLVIGGGPYTGAPAVAGMAALRAGADLAIILTPRRSYEAVAGYSPNLVVRPLVGDDLDFDDPSNRVTLNTWLKKAHSVVVGPGLGLFALTQRSVHHAIERATREHLPVVVDADALTALSERKDLLAPNVVVTPHAREFKNLAQRELPLEPMDARAEAAKGAAKELGATWLVKGPWDVITDGDRVKLNTAGHPAMSVGGTGDALAGTVGALLAKGMTPFDAARLAARILGDAGELTARDKGWGLVATDVVEAIPSVLVRALTRSVI